jgi:hypothetical protein
MYGGHEYGISSTWVQFPRATYTHNNTVIKKEWQLNHRVRLNLLTFRILDVGKETQKLVIHYRVSLEPLPCLI